MTSTTAHGEVIIKSAAFRCFQDNHSTILASSRVGSLVAINFEGCPEPLAEPDLIDAIEEYLNFRTINLGTKNIYLTEEKQPATALGGVVVMTIEAARCLSSWGQAESQFDTDVDITVSGCLDE